jgi:peptide/nickel transport system permease protein
MGAYIIRRIIQALAILIIVSILVFLAMRFLPGDPLMIYLSQSDLQQVSPEMMQSLRHDFGLDKPIYLQYADWVNGIFHGDLGTSLTYHDEVSTLLAERLPVTLHLGILSLIVSILLGVITGTLAAIRRGQWVDTLMTFLANIGITVPIFWLGILMIYALSLKLGWLPTNGYTPPFQDFWLSTRKLIMPVICLSVGAMASVSRQTRSSILEVIRQDYIRTAWSKGLREKDIIFRHTLKNGLVPIATLIGMQVSLIIGGSILIETVFNIPGMGRLLATAVFAQDLPVVQAGCLVISIMVVLTNLLVDISYGWMDPRIRYN